MSDNSPVIEGMVPEESHSAMLMTALFVSWINAIQVPYGAFTAREVKAALVAIGDNIDGDQFALFFNCLNHLLKGYKRWLTLSSRVQSDEMNPAIQRNRGKRKFTDSTIALTRAQKEDEERQDNKLKLKGIPMISLDPYIAQYIKPY
ncbi:Helicase C-terminal [Penicillium viridicatum]|nr:Helicase C-terminal [Penicillium viridicatum]